MIKLKGLKEEAERAGRPRLTGAEIELMNLAGPRTGLEMMEAVARDDADRELLQPGRLLSQHHRARENRGRAAGALDERMEIHLKKPGAIEFAQVFDEVAGGRRAPGAAER